MKQRWQEISDKINQLSLRERGLVLFSAVAVLYLVWDVIIFNPLAEVKATQLKELRNVEQKITALELEEKTLIATLQSDPDRDLKQQLAAITSTQAAVEQQLAQLSLGLVPVEQLVVILQDVLNKTGALKLESLRTLPVERLQFTAPASQADSSESELATGVYKHSVALVVKGSYFEMISYLQALEAMQWRFYWDELRFSEDQYPLGIYELRVFTLSTDEGLFGV